jgi:hypothetical protein
MDKADIRQISGGDQADGRKSAIEVMASGCNKKPVTLDVERLARNSAKVARALRYNEQMPAVAQLEKTNPSSAGGFAIQVS